MKGVRWPWSKEVAAARQEARQALESHAHSEQRRIDTETIREEALEVTKVQWEELRRNGWTEMLQQAWGGSR